MISADPDALKREKKPAGSGPEGNGFKGWSVKLLTFEFGARLVSGTVVGGPTVKALVAKASTRYIMLILLPPRGAPPANPM
jgi:hypothetical protein